MIKNKECFAWSDSTSTFVVYLTCFEKIISDVFFQDKQLAGVVQLYANANNWTLAEDVSDIQSSFVYISSTSGIEQLINLQHLAFVGPQFYCEDPETFENLTGSNMYYIDPEINLTANTALSSILIECMHLLHIDLSNNLLLEEISLPSNAISELDLSSNIALTSLNISYNPLSSIDLSKNSNLRYIYANGNKELSQIVISAATNPQLQTLDATGTGLSTIWLESLKTANGGWIQTVIY